MGVVLKAAGKIVLGGVSSTIGWELGRRIFK